LKIRIQACKKNIENTKRGKKKSAFAPPFTEWFNQSAMPNWNDFAIDAQGNLSGSCTNKRFSFG